MTHRPDHPPDLPTGAQLSENDMRVLDFIAEHGFDASKVSDLPEADRPRALALIAQMQVLDQYPAESADDSLVNATLARIDRWEAANDSVMQFPGQRIRNFRLSDFISIAALILVGLGVLLPIAARVRQQSLTTVCANNMRSLHTGLDAYARGNNGALPAIASIANFGSLFSSSPQPIPAGMQTSPLMEMNPELLQRPLAPSQMVIRFPAGTITITQGAPDWSGVNHSAHLMLLVANDYADMGALQCPACAAGLPCFAYRVPMRGQRFMLNTPDRSVVVADANPMIEARRRGVVPESRTMSSRNHAGSGQNLLFSDGTVEWKTSPILTNSPAAFMDNIWLPRDARGIEGMDLRAWPQEPADNFVAQ